MDFNRGLGGMGGAQPLAATMAGASMLAVECDPTRIAKRLETGYLDKRADTLEEALKMIATAHANKQAVSVGLLGNAADVFPELVKRGIKPDMVTDQTSAHDPLNGYLPLGYTLEQAAEMRKTNPAKIIQDAKASMAVQVQAMLAFHQLGIPPLTTAIIFVKWHWKPA